MCRDALACVRREVRQPSSPTTVDALRDDAEGPTSCFPLPRGPEPLRRSLVAVFMPGNFKRARPGAGPDASLLRLLVHVDVLDAGSLQLMCTSPLSVVETSVAP